MVVAWDYAGAPRCAFWREEIVGRGYESIAAGSYFTPWGLPCMFFYAVVRYTQMIWYKVIFDVLLFTIFLFLGLLVANNTTKN